MNADMIRRGHARMKQAEPELYALAEQSLEDATNVRDLSDRKWEPVVIPNVKAEVLR